MYNQSYEGQKVKWEEKKKICKMHNAKQSSTFSSFVRCVTNISSHDLAFLNNQHFKIQVLLFVKSSLFWNIKNKMERIKWENRKITTLSNECIGYYITFVYYRLSESHMLIC